MTEWKKMYGCSSETVTIQIYICDDLKQKGVTLTLGYCESKTKKSRY